MPKRYQRAQSQKGFTFIELLITLAIIGVLFLPVIQLFSQSLISVNQSQDVITAMNLGKWYMEKLKNFKITQEALRVEGDTVYPPEDQPPMIVNDVAWRIRREIEEGTDPLEVRVKVFHDSKDGSGVDPLPVFELVTLFEDAVWQRQ